MTSGSCPRCRSVLEGGAAFCHSCGLDLAAAASPGPPSPAAAPYPPVTAPFPMFPAPGLEVPANPMGHERAMAAMAGVLLLFTASVMLIFGTLYLFDRSMGWEEVWVDGDWYEERVVRWEWVLASVVMMASTGVGIGGGIAAVKATRYTLAMVGALMLLGCAVILQLDFGRWLDEPYGQVAFLLVLAIVQVLLLHMARPAFTTPVAPRRPDPRAYPIDNYGWSTTSGSARGGWSP